MLLFTTRCCSTVWVPYRRDPSFSELQIGRDHDWNAAILWLQNYNGPVPTSIAKTAELVLKKKCWVLMNLPITLHARLSSQINFFSLALSNNDTTLARIHGSWCSKCFTYNNTFNPCNNVVKKMTKLYHGKI